MYQILRKAKHLKDIEAGGIKSHNLYLWGHDLRA